MRIAIVGAGVSGLGAAHLLARAHDVELFERDERPGGHVHTFAHAGLALDTGFMVHNAQNYPLLTRLFDDLGVSTQESEMSFSVSCGDCGLEWSARRPFAQPGNLGRPRFHALLVEVTRWLRTAGRALDEPGVEDVTLEEYVAARGYSQRFRNHFLVPLTSALWSTAPQRALDFPAAHAIRFFSDHGMLGFRRFRWRTVVGGSHRYVTALLERFPGTMHTGLGVRAISRHADGVDLVTVDGNTRRFGKVVISTHADQALALLADPSGDEQAALSAFRYTSNDVALHTDERFLPRARAARSSWNYQLNDSEQPTMTYYLNKLQRLQASEHYCVTLNRTSEIDPARLIMRATVDHPLYTLETARAQARLAALSGSRNTLYAGAYLGNGFHEDGFASGVRAAAELGVAW